MYGGIECLGAGGSSRDIPSRIGARRSSCSPRRCTPPGCALELGLPSRRYFGPRGARLCNGGEAPPGIPFSPDCSARAVAVSRSPSGKFCRDFVSGGRYCFPRSRAAFSWCILSAVMSLVRAAAAAASLTSFLTTMPTCLLRRRPPACCRKRRLHPFVYARIEMLVSFNHTATTPSLLYEFNRELLKPSHADTGGIVSQNYFDFVIFTVRTDPPSGTTC